jgi:hypothetical protein
MGTGVAGEVTSARQSSPDWKRPLVALVDGIG